jgi:endonuclease/exonuclease/phosphatase family metal-dependent hydrolase
MSFNIWADSPLNRSWSRRRDAIADVVRRHSPDVAGLQEATAPMIRDLQEQLPEYRWVGVGRDDGRESGEFTPIFFHSARWNLDQQATFWLAAVCDLPGRGWDALCCRTVTWACLTHKETGRRCVHFNTHLDHLGRNARAQSALLLLQKIQEIANDHPTVVTGDFNCRESSTPYRILTGQVPFSEERKSSGPLRDARRESQAKPEGPYRTYRGLLQWIGIGRIDYIFVKNGFETLRYVVTNDARGASDHRPVLAELAFVNGVTSPRSFPSNAEA